MFFSFVTLAMLIVTTIYCASSLAGIAYHAQHGEKWAKKELPYVSLAFVFDDTGKLVFLDIIILLFVEQI